MISSDREDMGLVGTNSEQTYYVQAPYRCTLRDVIATAQNSDIGDADTVTVKNTGANTVGIATFGTDIAAGAKATYAANATYGSHVFAANELITVVVSALDAAGDRVKPVLVFDPYAVTATDFS